MRNLLPVRILWVAYMDEDIEQLSTSQRILLGRASLWVAWTNGVLLVVVSGQVICIEDAF